MSDEELRRLYAVVVARRTPARRETCPSPEALQSVVEQVGPEQERLAALDHIGECAACQAELEFFRMALGEPPRHRRFVLVGLAAAAVIVLAATLLWRRRGSPADELRGGGDRLELVAPRGVLASRALPGFTWRALPGASGYAFELLDERDSPIYQATISDTTLILPDSVVLVADRGYSWRVRGRRPSGDIVASPFVSFSLHTP
jgi:hypothetical protein